MIESWGYAYTSQRVRSDPLDGANDRPAAGWHAWVKPTHEICHIAKLGTTARPWLEVAPVEVVGSWLGACSPGDGRARVQVDIGGAFPRARRLAASQGLAVVFVQVERPGWDSWVAPSL